MIDGGMATVLASGIGGLALVAAGVVSWLTGRSTRRAERQRDTLAERDRLIDQLQEDRKADRERIDTLGNRIEALEKARAEDRRRIETLERERASDRELLDTARDHIRALEDLVPVPPGAPPRPAGL